MTGDSPGISFRPGGNENDREFPPSAWPVRLLNFTREFTRPRGWWILGLLWAAVMAWSHRRDMDPDGLSYLEMAARAAGGETGALINGYWSPGYPALLSVALRVFRPSALYEFQVAHLMNFVLFACALAAFSFCFRNSMALLRDVVDGRTGKVLTAFGYFVFLWSVGEYVGVGLNTPDLTVCAIVFLAAGMVARLRRSGSAWLGYAGLGLILAAGYYVKAAMLPLGFALIALLIVFPPPGIRRAGVALAGLCLLAGSIPLIVLTSRYVGHPAFSDTGTLNYAWYVGGIKPHWKSETEPRITPLHPPRRLSEHPVTLEFAEPFHVTESLWYEPSYWAAGTHVSFDLRRQVAAIGVTAEFVFMMLMAMGSLVAGLGALCLFVPRTAAPMLKLRESLWCLLWPAAALAMYGLVHMEWRFFGAFIVLFWVQAYRPVVVARQSRLGIVAPVLAVVCATLAIPLAGHFALAGGRAVVDLLHPGPTPHERLAAALLSAGVHEGDRIAYAGESFEMYFARLARVRVVAQIPDEEDFRRLDDSGRRDLAGRLASIGVKALVAPGSPAELATPAELAKPGKWVAVGSYSIILVRDLATD